MRHQLIIGNLKANPATEKELLAYFSFFSKKSMKKTSPFALALPFPFLGTAAAKKTKFISIGSQNITALAEGANTSGVTAKMIKSVGATFSLIGHSEVRHAGDTDEIIAEKVATAVGNGLMAVICVGEETRDEAGRYLEIIEHQVKSALTGLDKEQAPKLVFAYEPIWAVGGAVSATEKECFEVVIGIRRTLATLFGIEIAKKIRILYGGTVNEKNARTFIEEGGVDGLLIGRASWKPATFAKLLDTL